MSDVCKKFINNADEVVDDALKGLLIGDQQIQFHPHNRRVVLRKDVEELKENNLVTIVCGGGSGHEPFACGLVGKNSLTAAVAGNVFASPPSNHVSDALEATQSHGGTLVFVINYTGDRLHFGMAIERSSKAKLGSNAKVDLVYIDDDVALEDKLGVTIGGRGLAGALLVLQIAGVLAEDRKASFEEVRDTSRKVIENMGEPGLERQKLRSAHQIVATTLEKLTASKRLKLNKKEPIAVLINNLGSVSQLELGILQGEIIEWLVTSGYNVRRVFSGTLMTSIDGHGFGVTILKLTDESWLKLLDTPSHISSLWKASTPRTEPVKLPEYKEFDETKVDIVGVKVDDDTASKIEKAIRAACKKLIEQEELLNKLDGSCGDGDCGRSLKEASEAILKAADSKRLAFSHPKSLCLQLSKICEHSVGGTSGALYALLFGSGSLAFDNEFGDSQLRKAISEGLRAIIYYGHAKPGHRTLVDPLDAAAKSASDSSWEDVVKAVERSAEETASMKAKSGRAAYTSNQQQKEVDPGAKGVALWIRAAFDSLK
ncbi:Bifunctional ATP-dependent dihydroxyacetone kinase/FAD-AMP lyase [Aphelenchoides bicaudatus]|nr:Bifunctional ATP-dependent dihydroxyacetone kinase/FAD-AMP lyase [Aphelenchoides bicaudatus]